MGPVDVVWSPELLGYDFGPSHPMAPQRLELTIALAREFGLLDLSDVRVVAPDPASTEVLTTVHELDYVVAVQQASQHGVGDPVRGLGTADDPVFAGMHEAAARIAAGSVEAASAVWHGRAEHAVNIAGGLHHAMPGAAGGFCIYNDAALAVRRLLDEGAERVVYIDLDAHHGDGVEKAFWDDPRVLTISVHESGRTLFPGTGYASEIGGRAAEGSAVNVALPTSTSDGPWLRAVHSVVEPLVRAFEPQAVVSQHGCDAHPADPLTNLSVSVDAQRAAIQLVHELSHEVADGRWVALGGGGYAVVDVVPRVWTHLIGIAAHAPIAPHTPLPEAWREEVARRWGRPGPGRMTDGGTVTFRPWSAGYDPADDVDRAVMATRSAVFLHHSLDAHLD